LNEIGKSLGSFALSVVPKLIYQESEMTIKDLECEGEKCYIILGVGSSDYTIKKFVNRKNYHRLKEFFFLNGLLTDGELLHS
jgi:hypothetical protein